MMDPLWSETCWSTFKYFVILIVPTYYIIVHKLDNNIFKQFVFHRKHTACPSKLISLPEIIYAYKNV